MRGTHAPFAPPPRTAPLDIGDVPAAAYTLYRHTSLLLYLEHSLIPQSGLHRTLTGCLDTHTRPNSYSKTTVIECVRTPTSSSIPSASRAVHPKAPTGPVRLASERRRICIWWRAHARIPAQRQSRSPLGLGVAAVRVGLGSRAEPRTRAHHPARSPSIIIPVAPRPRRARTPPTTACSRRTPTTQARIARRTRARSQRPTPRRRIT